MKRGRKPASSRHSEVPSQSFHPLDGVRVEIKYKNEVQKKFARLIAQNDVVVCSGSPGTGKTLVTCAEALKLLKIDPRYKKIVLVKSVTALKDEEIGYLKGTMSEKMEPYMYSFNGNLEKLIPRDTVRKLKEGGYIEVLPIAFMRGVNLDSCFVIVDEAQNISLRNMRTIMTRIGEDCKMVILGDAEQSDLRNTSVSALLRVVEMLSSGDVPGAGSIEFTEDHIVRSETCAHIEAAFKRLPPIKET
jgi:phosphate starvation-inducible protein PhoH and related proteins